MSIQFKEAIEMGKLENKYKSDVSAYALSYKKISGKTPVDILGWAGGEEGEFVISKIVFDDRSEVFVEGEHDHPYFTPQDKKTLDILEKLTEEQDAEYE